MTLRRRSVILVLAATLLASGLFAPRVASRWRAETQLRDAAASRSLSSSSAHRTIGQGGERAPSIRDRWRRSKGRSELTTGGSDEAEDTASRKPEPSWTEQLFSADGATPVSRETVDRWLQAGHTNAADLLALRQAGAGSEYLEMALRQFPDDPRVLLASTSLHESSDVVRERMDRFRNADPNNALADYLSAWNELAAGNREKALEHLTAAGAKPGLQDYIADAARAAKELYRFEGRSDTEALAVGSLGVLLPHLSHLKTLANGLADMQKEFLAAGDMAGAAHVAEMGYGFGRQLATGPGAKTLIGELVGIAVEGISVQNLPQDSSYDFLGGNAGSFRQQLDQQREEIRSVGGQFEPWIRGASEADVVAYFEVFNQHGERAALQWLYDQNPPKAP